MKYNSLFIIILSLTAFNSHADTGKKSGYKYVIQNYFKPRKPMYLQHKSSPRNLSLHVGGSIFRETKEETLFPVSSFFFGFRQRVKEIPTVADVNLQINLFSSQLEEDRSTSIEINPQLILPDVRSGFPFYVGVGGGLGLYPRHIVKNKPALSFNTHVFTGVRLIDVYHNLGINGEVTAKLQVPFNDLKMYFEILVSGGLVFSF